MRHLLVTNDFPPKVGGIQTYLWELWRRLPPETFAVLTTAHRDRPAFDHAQPFRVERVPGTVLWPTPDLRRRIDRLAAQLDAGFVVLDPALPLGAVGPQLACPYLVVAHGAEIPVAGRIPVVGAILARVLRGGAGHVAGGNYAAAELARAAGRPLDVAAIPPGVDTQRFVPVPEQERPLIRRSLGLPEDGPLVVNVGRLGRPGAGGVRDRLRRGGGVRDPPGGRGQRRGAGGRGPRGDGIARRKTGHPVGGRLGPGAPHRRPVGTPSPWAAVQEARRRPVR